MAASLASPCGTASGPLNSALAGPALAAGAVVSDRRPAFRRLDASVAALLAPPSLPGRAEMLRWEAPDSEIADWDAAGLPPRRTESFVGPAAVGRVP